MKPQAGPPPPPKANRGPPAAKQRYLGLFTKAGLIVIALLMGAQIWPELKSAAGRRELWTKTIALLCSTDTYIFGAVLLANSLVYALLLRWFYPTAAAASRGLALAIRFVKRDELDVASDSSELKHFLLVFVLPILVLAAGIAEYHLLKEWTAKSVVVREILARAWANG